ncbi:hypothetical protein BTJ68_05614 [Hortaea werneckii EXF-2000]|uniref:Uncharacterized protein n=1 Tax=Hortaea werneckii EXF-2000 TaxID=1157616 RepID=A0A1Z5TBN8_HORWE|nr:hypothetical protein BTJ68_05614 [Hortaea werneckii EXF-2000]
MAAIGDQDNHTLTTAEGSQKPCGLLELPPELRNNIYELCFESAVDDKRANFNAPTPPGFAILQTCRQIHDEAIQIYQVADRKYWSNTHFWIEERTYKQAKAGAESMRPEKVHLMNKITINAHFHKLVMRDETELQMQRAEQKCLNKQELLELLSALNRSYWVIAK